MFNPPVFAMVLTSTKHEQQVHHKTMNHNNNANNNHNNRQISPVRESKSGISDREKSSEAKVVNKEMEESRRVVESFLKRSLSHNAKASTEIMKPEGYHKLRKDGRLPFYQRQQSKPETGVFTKRVNQSSGESFKAISLLPSRPSLNELTSESKKRLQQQAANREEPRSSLSHQDVRLNPEEEEADLQMIRSLISDDMNETSFQSSDSLTSASEGISTIRRRKSFTKAVTRKSVISYMEKRKQRQSSGECSSTATTPTRKSKTPDPTRKSKTPDPTRKFSTNHRKTSVSEPLAATWHGPTSHSDPNKCEDARTLPERKTSIKERMRKLISGPSNKKRSQYKRSFHHPDSETEDGRKSPQKVESRSSASPSVVPRHDYQTQTSTSPRRAPPAERRSPSPSKGSQIGKLIRTASVRAKPSPKSKHRDMPTSTSSETIAALATGALERDKSGSLPLNMRLGLRQAEYLIDGKTRRYSEDLTASSPNKDPRTLAGYDKPPDRPHTGETPHSRPSHLDLRHKKKSGKKLKKFLLFWKKRHPSGSSSSSSVSSRSQSLPDISSALEQEENDSNNDEIARETKSDDQQADEFDDDTLGDTINGQLHSRPYHHRGSLSFSSGDLDGLSLPEKQKIYDEIAETIERISQKYNKHMQSRSSTPGSRIVTPDSSISAGDSKSFKAARSEPPGRQSSRGPVLPTSRTFRPYLNDENTPAMKTYLNLVKNKSSDGLSSKRAARMPSFPARRHTHHTYTGSLDSPYNRHRVSRSSATRKATTFQIPPETEHPIPAEPHRAGGDVVDSVPLPTDDSATPAGDVEGTRPMHTRQRTIFSEDTSVYVRQFSNSGSEVDDTQYCLNRHRSVSLGFDPGASTSATPFQETSYEDKLVGILVQMLTERGDQYNQSIDSPHMDAEFEKVITNYMATSTFSRFQTFFNSFLNNVKSLVSSSPSRHPEVFPIVMAFNMSGLVMNIVSSNSTRQAVDNVVNYSTRMFTELCQGRTLETVLRDLNETDAELSSAETPDSVSSSSPRRHGGTDDEVD